MVLDHIGIVVRSLEDGIRQWHTMFGYSKSSDIVLNTRQKVRVVFLSKEGGVTVKLIEPSEPGSPVSMFSRKGGGLHHLCFRCVGLPGTIRELRKQGAVLMVPPQPGEAFNGHDIAFLMIKGNINVELIDTEEKAGLRAEG